VIGALQPNAVDDAAKRQSSASMHTQVPPGEELVAGTPHDDVLAEYPGRDWAAVRKLGDKRYGVPIIYQDGVIDHCNFLERAGMLR
jgi:hypothetical protein